MEGWRESTIGDVFETVTGSTPPKSRKELYGDFIPFIKPPELANKPIYASTDGLSEDGAEQSRILPVDSVLVSCIGILGKLGINKTPASCNQQINAIKPNCNAAYPEFVFYYCQSSKFSEQLHDLASGTTVPIVNKRKFNSISIPRPPLCEQERIVAILDETFAAIATATANAEKNLVNARKLFESYLFAVLDNPSADWIPAAMEDVTDLLSGFSFKSTEYAEDGYFLVRIGNVQDGQMALDKPKFVQLDEKTSKFALQSDDLLISLTGNIGRVARVREPDLPAALNQRVARLRVSNPERLDTGFLYMFLRSSKFRNSLVDAGHGAVQQNVSPKTIAALSILLPPLEEQRRITDLLEDMATSSDLLGRTASRQLDLLSNLKQSLLHKAFTGEFTAEKTTADRTLSEAGV